MKKVIMQPTFWKPTITQKVVSLFHELEAHDGDIAGATTNDLIFAYYYRNGLSNLARAYELHEKISTGELPSMESVSRAIRRARSLDPKWAKVKQTDLNDQGSDQGHIDDDLSLFKKQA